MRHTLGSLQHAYHSHARASLTDREVVACSMSCFSATSLACASLSTVRNCACIFRIISSARFITAGWDDWWEGDEPLHKDTQRVCQL